MARSWKGEQGTVVYRPVERRPATPPATPWTWMTEGSDADDDFDLFNVNDDDRLTSSTSLTTTREQDARTLSETTALLSLMDMQIDDDNDKYQLEKPLEHVLPEVPGYNCDKSPYQAPKENPRNKIVIVPINFPLPKTTTTTHTTTTTTETTNKAKMASVKRRKLQEAKKAEAAPRKKSSHTTTEIGGIMTKIIIQTLLNDQRPHVLLQDGRVSFVNRSYTSRDDLFFMFSEKIAETRTIAYSRRLVEKIDALIGTLREVGIVETKRDSFTRGSKDTSCYVCITPEAFSKFYNKI